MKKQFRQEGLNVPDWRETSNLMDISSGHDTKWPKKSNLFRNIRTIKFTEIRTQKRWKGLLEGYLCIMKIEIVQQNK
jgi:hypothetical protein